MQQRVWELYTEELRSWRGTPSPLQPLWPKVLKPTPKSSEKILLQGKTTTPSFRPKMNWQLSGWLWEPIGTEPGDLRRPAEDRKSVGEGKRAGRGGGKEVDTKAV